MCLHLRERLNSFVFSYILLDTFSPKCIIYIVFFFLLSLLHSSANCQCACSEQFNLPMPMNRLLKALKKYGVPQDVRGIESQETLTVISNTLTYMENLSDKFDDMSDVNLLTSSCKNLEKRCSFWAGLGECNKPGNEYMRLHCAPACQECNLMDIQTRCPSLGVDGNIMPPALVPGGLNTMFERIVLNVPTEDNMVDYTVNILSRPGESNVNIKEESFFRDFAQPPWLITLDNFLTDKEANDLIELGNNHGYEVVPFEQVEQTDMLTDMLGIEVNSVTSQQCTGKISWCTYADDCITDTLIEKIQDRISKVTGIPVVNSEHLEIVKYEVGDYYRKHNDYILSQQGGRAGSRVLSFFVYLSDDDDDDGGGNLNFPTLKKKIRPKKGTAVLWPTVRNSNPTDVDIRTDYEIEDVKHGTVYSVATWLHLHEYDFGCT